MLNIKGLFTSDIVYLRITDIKKKLNIKDTKEIKKELQDLVKEGIIYYDESTKRYYSTLVYNDLQKILDIFNTHEYINKEYIIKCINNDDIDKLLQQLEIDGFIYQNNNIYYKIPSKSFTKIIINIITNNKDITLNKIKELLNGKMNNDILLDILKDLETQSILYFNKDNHTYELLDILVIKEKIFNYIKENKSSSIKDIKQNILPRSNESFIINILKRLEKEGNIFYNNETNKYIYLSKEYIKTMVYATKKGELHTFINGEYYSLEQYNSDLLANDTILLNKNYELVNIINRGNDYVVCEITKKGINIVGNNNLKVKMDKYLLQELNLPIGTRFLGKVATYALNHVYDITYIETLGHKNDLDKELETIAYNNGFVVKYTQEELEQVENTAQEVTEEDKKGRIDLTNEVIFTIDGSHSKDLDDAISVKKLDNGMYELIVSIAAVHHYIRFGTPLWHRAEKNTTSLYLVDRVLHMLHYKISNGICSLNPGVERLAKSFKMIIDTNGNITDFEIMDTIIKSRKQMTYEDVNKILDEGIVPAGYEEYVDNLLLMQELSQILTNRHQIDGALNFGSKEIHFVMDDDNVIKDVEVIPDGSSEKIIENFMVATNEGMANYMLNLGIVFIYRNHEIPFEGKINEVTTLLNDIGYKVNKLKNANDPHLIQQIIRTLSNKEEFFILTSLLIKSMKKAYYSTINKGHYALALNAYSQTTSPIRRFLDLLIQYILDNLENICNPDYDIEKLKDYVDEMCERASMMERNANKAEYEADKLYMLKYCVAHPDLEYNGYIAQVKSDHFIVKTSELIEGIVYFDDIEGYGYNKTTHQFESYENKQKLTEGSKLIVKLKDYNTEFRTIYFKGYIPNREMLLTRKKESK